MPKRQLSAKEILQDIHTGMNDPALMEKYHLSAQGLQSVFTKLVAAGGLKQAELDNRASAQESSVNVIWKCPACGKPQSQEFEECPDCGVIVSKYKDRQQKTFVGEEPKTSAGRVLSSWRRGRLGLIVGLAAITVAAIVGLWSYRAHEAREARKQLENSIEAMARAKREAREQEMLEKMRSIEKMTREKKNKEELEEKLRAIDEESRLVRPGETLEDVHRRISEGAQRLREKAGRTP